MLVIVGRKEMLVIVGRKEVIVAWLRISRGGRRV